MVNGWVGCRFWPHGWAKTAGSLEIHQSVVPCMWVRESRTTRCAGTRGQMQMSTLQERGRTRTSACTRGRTRAPVSQERAIHADGHGPPCHKNMPYTQTDVDLRKNMRHTRTGHLRCECTPRCGHPFPSCRSPSVVRCRTPHRTSPTRLDFSCPIAWPPGTLGPTNTAHNMSSTSSTPLYLSTPLALLLHSPAPRRRAHSFFYTAHSL